MSSRKHFGNPGKSIPMLAVLLAAAVIPEICVFARQAVTPAAQLEGMELDESQVRLTGGLEELPDAEPARIGRRLNHISWQQFENEIGQLWGVSLRVKSLDPQSARIQVELPGTRTPPNSLVIDRINNLVTFEGRMNDALVWNEMVELIDIAPELNDGRVQLIGMGRAESEVIRAAATSLGLQELEGSQVRTALNAAFSRPAAATVFSTLGESPARSASSTAVLKPLHPQEQDVPQLEVPQNQETLPEQPRAIYQIEDNTLSGKVQIKIIDEYGTIVLIGAPEDTAKVKRMIEELVKASEVARPSQKRIDLFNANAQSIKTTVDTIYEAQYRAEFGEVSITPFADRNSLLVIGSPSAIAAVEELVAQLDIVSPETDTPLDFRVFRIKNISAIDAAQKLRGYFFVQDQQQANTVDPPQVWVTSLHGPVAILTDYRANAVIVKGSNEAISRAARFIEQIDSVQIESKNMVRLFKIQNALASDLAIVLQYAINGNMEGAPQAFAPGQEGIQQQQQNQQGQELSRARTTMLEIMALDGNQKVASGLLFDVSVTANASANQLIVSAPEESMPLVAELIRQLDVMPDAETQLKVIQLLHGDAQQILLMLQTLFTQQQAGQGFNQGFGGNQGTNATSNLPLQSASATPGAALINLRFSVEPQTNTIIVAGPAGDLQVVEDLLYRLDEAPLDNRIVTAYKLKNASAEDLATAINEWLTSRQDIISADPRSLNAVEAARRQVIVVPEIVTNSLIINATPAYYDEIVQLVEMLDRRPPMVKVKVLIAEVALDDLMEFGVEFGIQDSLLFDRGAGTIGFPFNQAAIGNNNNALSLGTRENLAGQGLSNLNIGRSNSTLGYGGLVLSAGNESISVLMRALENRGIVRVLSTPNITTLENLQGRVQVGANVPRITGANTNNNIGGGTNITVEDTSVGVILQITARVSPDGMIIMNVDAVNSSLGPESQGVPVFVSDGQVIRSPQINITQAQSTIMARSGQTVAFSGLIQDTTSRERRGSPILSDLPVLGPLFSFESENHRRTELLIILTPYLVDSDAQIEASNQVEMDRMHWCLADISEIYGPLGYGEFDPENTGSGIPATYYPDQDPAGMNPVYLPLEEAAPIPESGYQGEQESTGPQPVTSESETRN
jgi:general secretion pathway protein D